MKRMLALVAVAAIMTTGSVAEAGGPALRRFDSVKAAHTNTYTLTFRGGEPAEVLISGDGDTDLDLLIYDESGNLVAKDDDASDDCLVRWFPKWTGKFYVRVVNHGSVSNNYLFATN